MMTYEGESIGCNSQLYYVFSTSFSIIRSVKEFIIQAFELRQWHIDKAGQQGLPANVATRRTSATDTTSRDSSRPSSTRFDSAPFGAPSNNRKAANSTDSFDFFGGSAATSATADDPFSFSGPNSNRNQGASSDLAWRNSNQPARSASDDPFGNFGPATKESTHQRKSSPLDAFDFDSANSALRNLQKHIDPFTVESRGGSTPTSKRNSVNLGAWDSSFPNPATPSNDVLASNSDSDQEDTFDPWGNSPSKVTGKTSSLFASASLSNSPSHIVAPKLAPPTARRGRAVTSDTNANSNVFSATTASKSANADFNFDPWGTNTNSGANTDSFFETAAAKPAQPTAEELAAKRRSSLTMLRNSLGDLYAQAAPVSGTSPAPNNCALYSQFPCSNSLQNNMQNNGFPGMQANASPINFGMNTGPMHQQQSGGGAGAFPDPFGSMGMPQNNFASTSTPFGGMSNMTTGSTPNKSTSATPFDSPAGPTFNFQAQPMQGSSVGKQDMFASVVATPPAPTTTSQPFAPSNASINDPFASLSMSTMTATTSVKQQNNDPFGAALQSAPAPVISNNIPANPFDLF